jgi:hypothetical protein
MRFQLTIVFINIALALLVAEEKINNLFLISCFFGEEVTPIITLIFYV